MKLLILLIACLLQLMPLGARDLVVTGTGATYEEARDNALDALAIKYLGVTVYSSTETVSEATTTGGSYDRFSSESNTFYDGNLLGVTFRDKGGGAERTVEAVIAEDSADLYLLELGKISKRISDLYETRHMGEFTEQYSVYQELISLFRSYESWSNIAQLLGVDGGSIPALDIDANLASVYKEYIRFIEVNEDKLGYKIKDRNAKIEEKERYEEDLRELEKARAQAEAEMQKAQADGMEARNARVEEMTNSYIAAAGNFEVIENTEDPSDYIRPISQQLVDIALFKKQYSAMLLLETENVMKERDIAQDAQRNLPFRQAEMDASGNVLEKAQKHRNDEVEYIGRQFRAELDSILDKIHSTMGPELIRRRMHLSELHDAVNDRLFRIDSEVDDVILENADYDGDLCRWNIVVRIPKLGKNFSVSFFVPYEVMTGKEVVGPPFLDDPDYREKSKAYDSYNDDVEAINRLFAKNMFRFNMDYFITCPVGSDTYRIDMSKIRFAAGSMDMASIDPATCYVTGMTQKYHSNVESILDFSEFPLERFGGIPADEKTGIPSLRDSFSDAFSKMDAMKKEFVSNDLPVPSSMDDVFDELSALAEQQAENIRMEKRTRFVDFGWSADMKGSILASPYNASIVGKIGIDASIGLRVSRFFMGLNTGLEYMFDPSFLRVDLAMEFGAGFLKYRDLYAFTRLAFNESNNACNLDLGIKYRILDILTFGVSANFKDNFKTMGASLLIGVSGI